MKVLSLLTAVLALGFALVTVDAEAAKKRLGAGNATGMQRQASPPANASSAAPSQAPSTAQGQPATAAPQATPNRSWTGPLAGLAAGLGLAALASYLGVGEELASMLMIGLVVMAVMALVGLLMRRRAAGGKPATAGTGSLQFATAGADSATASRSAHQLSMPASGSGTSMTTSGNVPAGFDAAGFVRNAKIGFIRLQAANDAGNLDDIRDFTTPEMFAEIRVNIAERGTARQETDVVALDADVVDVAEETTRFVVSVRFRAQIREEKDGVTEQVEETWHMIKPRDGKSGWVLAGIQQTQ